MLNNDTLKKKKTYSSNIYVLFGLVCLGFMAYQPLYVI